MWILPTSKVETESVSRSGRGFHPLRDASVNIPLGSQGRKLVLILAIGIPAAVLALKVTREAIAARLARGLNVQNLMQAIALDPGNASYDHKLGLIYSYSLDQKNLRDAVTFLRKATDLNPHKALYWSDLAEVCDTLNDPACSNPAVMQALRLAPMTPRFEWRAGNHYLQTGHTKEALQHFRRLLTLDNTYAQPVFRISLATVGDPETVYQKLLPPTARPQLKLAYLDFVSSQGDIGFANQLWKQIASEGLACRFEEVDSYLELLLSADDVQQATKVWRDLQQSGVIARAEKGRKNLVYNGGFERSPLNAGFGWHDPNTPYVETDFRDPSAHRGARCLRVDYAAGRNLESEPAYQLVPVEPRQTYQLRAYVRSNRIISKSGPRLWVVDPECPTCLNVSTRTTAGTTPWHLLTLNFTTGARTQIIRLSVWRPRSDSFPMEISGSFWLDDVSIEASNSMSKDTLSKR